MPRAQSMSPASLASHGVCATIDPLHVEAMIERNAVAPDAVAKARTFLSDSASRWSAVGRLHTVPADGLWVCLSCPSCGSMFDRTFRCAPGPWAASAQEPLFRDSRELAAVVQEALVARPGAIAEREWEESTQCACGALAERHSSAVFHAVVGTGASLVAIASVAHEPSLFRLDEGSGSFAELEASPAAIRSSYGHPLTLFDSWAELLAGLASPLDSVVGYSAEPGVWLFAAPNEEALESALESALDFEAIIVGVTPGTIRSGAWPASTIAMTERLEAGLAVALIVERPCLIAQARAWARTRMNADVREREDGMLLLHCVSGEWPIIAGAVTLGMAQFGLTLAQACARSLEEARSALADRTATLRRMTELVPGASFEIEGTTAILSMSHRRDKSLLDLTELPPGAVNLASDELIHQAAFIFETAPLWADRLRVCLCGAPLSIERRLVSWPMSSGDPPWALTHDHEASAAQVVALCCDRHVRVLSEIELRKLGLDESVLKERLDVQAHWGRTRVHVATGQRSESDPVVLVRAPFGSGLVLFDARVNALLAELGRPFGDENIAAYAVGHDVLVLVPARIADPEDLVRAAMSGCNLDVTTRILCRRELDSSVPPRGAFDVETD